MAMTVEVATGYDENDDIVPVCATMRTVQRNSMNRLTI